MPPRRKRARTDFDTVVSCTEKWNKSIVKRILLMKETPVEVTRILEQVNKIKGDRVVVPYRYATSTPREGRLYGVGPTFQSIKGCYRRLIANGEYHDIDMANCYPRILLDLAQKNNVSMQRLNHYIHNRESVLEELMDRHTVPREIAKKMVLLTINFGDYFQVFSDALQVQSQTDVQGQLALRNMNDKFLTDLKIESNRLYELLKSQDEYKELHEMCEKTQKRNIAGCFMAHVYFRHEGVILHKIQQVLISNGYTVGSLIFDGMLVQRRSPPKALRERREQFDRMNRPLGEYLTELERDEKDFQLQCEVHLRDTMNKAQDYVKDETGFNIVLEEKPLTPSKEELELLEGEVNTEAMKPCERFIHLLSLEAKVNKYQRRNGQVMKPHESIRGVYLPLMSGSEYINVVLRNDEVFQTDTFVKKLTDWFETQDHPDFPLMDAGSRTTIAFRDAWIDITKPDGLYWMDDDKRREQCNKMGVEFIEHPPTTFHYFDCNVEEDNSTPMWHKLVNTQLYDNDEYDAATHEPTVEETEMTMCFEAMIGRLFLPTGFDNWQVWPFLKGEGDTGKSTIVDIVRAMFPTEEVVSYDSGRQQTFGLEDIYDKRLLLFPDIPRRLDQCLAEDKMCSMVSGELLSVARKHQTPVTVKWQVPALLSGNYVPSYEDVGGRIVRRFVMFQCNTMIRVRDTTLKTRILNDELPKIVLNCIANYHSLREKVGDDQLKKHLPKLITAGEEEIRTETSPLYDFIMNGSDYWEFVHEDGATTALLDLRNAFQNHLKFNLRRADLTWKKDDNSIKAAGYKISKIHVCKVCGSSKPSKKGCDEHWENGNNRKKVTHVVGMRMNKLKGSDGAYFTPPNAGAWKRD